MTDDTAIPAHRPEEVVDLLTQVSAEQISRGWNRPPELFSIRMEPVPATTDQWRRVASPHPVPPRAWFAHTKGPVGLLGDLVAEFRQPHSQAVLITAASVDPYSRVVAWGLAYVLRHNTYRSQLVLLVDAIDLNGRFYRLTQKPGETAPVATVDDTPAGIDHTIAPLLAALVDATR
ncbi:hypothetical protein [Longispora urticae]